MLSLTNQLDLVLFFAWWSVRLMGMSGRIVLDQPRLAESKGRSPEVMSLFSIIGTLCLVLFFFFSSKVCPS
jgi:hypothetical protein